MAAQQALLGFTATTTALHWPHTLSYLKATAAFGIKEKPVL